MTLPTQHINDDSLKSSAETTPMYAQTTTHKTRVSNVRKFRLITSMFICTFASILCPPFGTHAYVGKNFLTSEQNVYGLDNVSTQQLREAMTLFDSTTGLHLYIIYGQLPMDALLENLGRLDHGQKRILALYIEKKNTLTTNRSYIHLGGPANSKITSDDQLLTASTSSVDVLKSAARAYTSVPDSDAQKFVVRTAEQYIHQFLSAYSKQKPQSKGFSGLISILAAAGTVVLGFFGYKKYRTKKIKSKAQSLVHSETITTQYLESLDTPTLRSFLDELLKKVSITLRNYRNDLLDAEEILSPALYADLKEIYTLSNQDYQKSLSQHPQNSHNNNERNNILATISTAMQAQERLKYSEQKYTELRQQLVQAPETLQKAKENMIYVDRKIIEARQTVSQLSTTYNTTMLNPLHDDIDEAAELHSFARKSLDYAEPRLKNNSTEALENMYKAIAAIKQARELVEGIDSAEMRILTSQKELPEKIDQAQSDYDKITSTLASHKGEMYLNEENQKELQSVKHQLEKALIFARKNMTTNPIQSHNNLVTAQSESIKVFVNLADTQEEMKKLTDNVRVLIEETQRQIDAVQKLISLRGGIVGSAPRVKVQQAEDYLASAKDQIQQPTKQNLSSAQNQAQLAYRSAESAFDLAQGEIEYLQQRSRTQYGNYAQGNTLNTFMAGLGGAFIGNSLSQSLFGSNTWSQEPGYGGYESLNGFSSDSGSIGTDFGGSFDSFGDDGGWDSF